MPKKPKKLKSNNSGLSITSLASSQPVGRVFTSGGKFYQTYKDPASQTGWTLKTWSNTDPESFSPINEPYSVKEQQDNETATTAARETGREQIRLNDSTINNTNSTIQQRKDQIAYQYKSLQQQGKQAEADRMLRKEQMNLENDLGWGRIGADVAKTGADLSGPANPFSFLDYADGLQTAGVLPKAFQNIANNQRGTAFSPYGAQPTPLNMGTLMANLQGQSVPGSVAPGTLPGGANAAAAGGMAGAGPSMQDQANASYAALLPTAMNPGGVGSGVFESQDSDTQKAALDAFGKLGVNKGRWVRDLMRAHPQQGSSIAA